MESDENSFTPNQIYNLEAIACELMTKSFKRKSPKLNFKKLKILDFQFLDFQNRDLIKLYLCIRKTQKKFKANDQQLFLTDIWEEIYPILHIKARMGKAQIYHKAIKNNCNYKLKGFQNRDFILRHYPHFTIHNVFLAPQILIPKYRSSLKFKKFWENKVEIYRIKSLRNISLCKTPLFIKL